MPTRAPRLAPRALTLIELLVTIVILVTLIAAVLPAISPNNDSRKIREAARQLVSLFAQAQAQAARDGRPVGVGFSDKWTDANNDTYVDPGELTGMALEAYIIAEPAAFTGFNTSSALMVRPANSNAPATGTNPPLVNLQFGHGVGGEGMTTDFSDAIPPRLFRGAFVDTSGNVQGSGDLVEVGQELFEIVTNDCDDADDTDTTPDTRLINGETFLNSQLVVTARWLTWRYRPLALISPGGKAYRVRRRPMSTVSPSRSSAEVIQFPRGIGIDLDPTDGNRTVGIVFSPNGAVDSYYQDGAKTPVNEPFFILLGRTENANPPTLAIAPAADMDYDRYDFRTMDPADDDAMAQRRREVNLLNADSRWVVITPAGRVLASENAIFDPRTPPFLTTPPLQGTDLEKNIEQRRRQREAARQYAAQFQSEGGG